MKKFRLLFLLVFSTIALVSCEDKLEDEKIEEENGDISCIVRTKKYYDKDGRVESYINYSYKDKLLVTDSTFDKNNVLTIVNLYEYDGNNRILFWETYKEGTLSFKSEYTYSGSSYVKKIYYMSTTGRLNLWQETHYEGKNEIMWIYYNEDGSESTKNIYTYQGNLRVREEVYREGVLNSITVNTYENNLLKEKKRLASNNYPERVTKYFYEEDFLVRTEEYDQSSVMLEYKVYEKTGANSIKEKAYYMPDNILSYTITKEYNAKKDLIYQKREYSYGDYTESSYQITYNECDCRLSVKFRFKEVYLSNSQSNREGFSHYENEGVECPL